MEEPDIEEGQSSFSKEKAILQPTTSGASSSALQTMESLGSVCQFPVPGTSCTAVHVPESSGDQNIVIGKEFKNSIIGNTFHVTSFVGAGGKNSDEIIEQLLKSVSSIPLKEHLDDKIEEHISSLRMKYTTNCAYMRSFIWDGDGYDLPIEDYFVNLKVEKCDRMGIKIFHENIQFEKMFIDKNVQTILITADPGFGKTTLVKKLAYDWAKGCNYISHFKLVIVLHLRELGDVTLSKAVENETKQSLEALRQKELKFLVILDGYDEIRSKETVLEFIKQRPHNMTILLTSRRPEIKDVKKEFQLCFSICRFTKENQIKYIKQVNRINSLRNIDVLLKKVTHENFISYLAECPLLLHMLCCLHNDIEDLSSLKNLGSLYTEMFRLIIKRYQQRYEEDSSILREGKWFCGEDLLTRFGKICPFYLKGKNPITPKSLKLDFPDEKEYNFICRLDILISTPIISKGEEIIEFHPLHRTFFEYLYSLHLSNINSSSTLKRFIDVNASFGWYNLILFLTGLLDDDDLLIEAVQHISELEESSYFYIFMDELKKNNKRLWKKCVKAANVLFFDFAYYYSFIQEEEKTLLEGYTFAKILIDEYLVTDLFSNDRYLRFKIEEEISRFKMINFNHFSICLKHFPFKEGRLISRNMKILELLNNRILRFPMIKDVVVKIAFDQKNFRIVGPKSVIYYIDISHFLYVFQYLSLKCCRPISFQIKIDFSRKISQKQMIPGTSRTVTIETERDIHFVAKIPGHVKSFNIHFENINTESPSHKFRCLISENQYLFLNEIYSFDDSVKIVEK